MKHCPGCTCRRPRLSDDLPASELIRMGAADAQVLHGLCYLGERAVKARKATLRSLLADVGGLIHEWAHLTDVGRWWSKRDREVLRWRIAHWAERLEGRL